MKIIIKDEIRQGNPYRSFYNKEGFDRGFAKDSSSFEENVKGYRKFLIKNGFKVEEYDED